MSEFWVTDDICVRLGYDAVGDYVHGYDRDATAKEIMAWYDARNEHLHKNWIAAEGELARHRTELRNFLRTHKDELTE